MLRNRNGELGRGVQTDAAAQEKAGQTEKTGETDMLSKLHKKRDHILQLARQHGAKNVRVFGSYARGEERPESDVDFLVDMEGSLLQRIALIQGLEDILGRKADVVTEQGLHWYIRERVIKEAILL